MKNHIVMIVTTVVLFIIYYVSTRGSLLHFVMQISEAQRNVGSNHAVSGLKFKILQHFMRLGYAVLLSDVDIVTLKNPFTNLFRDTDVESMSDGWTNQTAYGRVLISSYCLSKGPFPYHRMYPYHVVL